uniref:Uncharacterized protein n=1 Tax=Setaria viridis TaxID=4556 RepID=A0A4U6T0L0_SETVI|nr:hypothetical protein SEVIR_9G276800v2 [Setaria viridis]
MLLLTNKLLHESRKTLELESSSMEEEIEMFLGSTSNTSVILVAMSVLKVALDHGKASGVTKSHDRVVVCQKVGDSSVVKIIELDD